MALTYSQMSLQSQDTSFIQRVEFAVLQVAIQNKMEAQPAAASTTVLADEEDRLARQIAQNPYTWAVKFAPLVAVQLIAKTTLLDPAVTTDSDIFSAVTAVYDKMLTNTI